MKVTYFNKKYVKDNVIKNFVIKNYFLNLTFKQFENFRD